MVFFNHKQNVVNDEMIFFFYHVSTGDKDKNVIND